MSDLISRADAIEVLTKVPGVGRRAIDELKALPAAEATGALDEAITKYVADGYMLPPSAEAVSMEEHVKELNDLASAWKNKFINAEKIADQQASDAYKRGFEDAKRAFLVEYARESENMRKRNAELEVMLNAYRAMSAEAVHGEWIRVGHDIYECSLCQQNVMTRDIDCYAYCHGCGAKMKDGDNE